MACLRKWTENTQARCRLQPGAVSEEADSKGNTTSYEQWILSPLTETPPSSHYNHITYKSPEPWIEMRRMALVLHTRSSNKFNRHGISALGFHVIYVYVMGSVKNAAHAEGDGTGIIMGGLVETSLSACSECRPHAGQRCTHQWGRDRRGKWKRWRNEDALLWIICLRRIAFLLPRRKRSSVLAKRMLL